MPDPIQFQPRNGLADAAGSIGRDINAREVDTAANTPVASPWTQADALRLFAGAPGDVYLVSVGEKHPDIYLNTGPDADHDSRITWMQDPWNKGLPDHGYRTRIVLTPDGRWHEEYGFPV
jgi:hypothetical protein